MTTTTASPAGASSPPPLAERVLRPFQQFARTESSGGIVLMVCTALALAWANSPWSESYFHLWEQKLTIGTEGFGLTETLHHWINDGLMAVFFFLVGLEIKREMLVGDLASVRKAALPIAGAIGGMVVPAALYMVFNAGGPGASGWAIPMATDIAFALGVLALLGSRVPASLKIFLAALAIADDIGAVLVIAFFYATDLSLTSLGVAAGVLALLFACRSAGVRRPSVYAVLGVVLWVAMLKSGVHATVAGVLLAMTIPARTRIDEDEFVRTAHANLRDFERACGPGSTVLSNRGQQEAIHALETACEEVQAPLLKVEHKLHGMVAYGIMPLFAFANAGIRVNAELLAALSLPVLFGVLVGLVVGKPLGITLLSWASVRAGLAEAPAAASWRALHGVSWLGGIGFTMSLFIATLAFGSGPLLESAKVGILGASVIAGVVGWLLLRGGARQDEESAIVVGEDGTAVADKTGEMLS